MTKGTFWNFQIDFTSAVGSIPTPDYGVANRDFELVVVTFEDGNGRSYGNSWMHYYKTLGYYDIEMNAAEKDALRQQLIENFCR